MARMRSSGKPLNLTRQSYNELAAVVYADIFGYPLTVKEAKLWAVRKTREKNSAEKLKIAENTVSWLKKIPMIEAIFLTGSVAAKNAKTEADIDLMIITSPSTLWITRAIVVTALRLLNKYPFICTNIFLDTDHLEIENKSLYTAHEVLQAKCLFDRGGTQKMWLKKNDWTKKYLPKAFRLSQPKMLVYDPANRRGSRPALFGRSSLIFTPIELLAFLIQYFYMKPKMTNEKVGWGFAFFHPRDLSVEVLKKFSKKVAKLGIMWE